MLRFDNRTGAGLLAGRTSDGRPLHVVCTTAQPALIVITVYALSGTNDVIDNVPAEVCPVCGDVLLTPATARQIEALLRTAAPPVRRVPLYEYA